MLVSFQFENSQFEVTDQLIGLYGLRIWRECRTKPFLGMQQPTPFGAILGLDPVLEFRIDGVRAKNYEFRLYHNQKLLHRDLTNNRGESNTLLLPLEFSGRCTIEFNGLPIEYVQNKELTQWLEY